jgi:hypothetical protein
MGVPAAPVDRHAHEAVIYDQRTGATEWTSRVAAQRSP